MYEPFPGNYVWNLSVNICIGMGGAIGEIERRMIVFANWPSRATTPARKHSSHPGSPWPTA